MTTPTSPTGPIARPTSARATTTTSPAAAGNPQSFPANAPTASGSTANLLDQIGWVLNAPVVVARRLLPTSPVPVALGTGALLLAGVVDLPVAGALGLGYLALRSWRTRS